MLVNYIIISFIIPFVNLNQLSNKITTHKQTHFLETACRQILQTLNYSQTSNALKKTYFVYLKYEHLRFQELFCYYHHIF